MHENLGGTTSRMYAWIYISFITNIRALALLHNVTYLITHGSYVPYPTLQAQSLLQTVLGTIIFHLLSITLGMQIDPRTFPVFTIESQVIPHFPRRHHLLATKW